MKPHVPTKIVNVPTDQVGLKSVGGGAAATPLESVDADRANCTDQRC